MHFVGLTRYLSTAALFYSSLQTVLTMRLTIDRPKKSGRPGPPDGQSEE